MSIKDVLSYAWLYFEIVYLYSIQISWFHKWTCTKLYIIKMWRKESGFYAAYNATKNHKELSSSWTVNYSKHSRMSTSWAFSKSVNNLRNVWRDCNTQYCIQHACRVIIGGSIRRRCPLENLLPCTLRWDKVDENISSFVWGGAYAQLPIAHASSLH